MPSKSDLVAPIFSEPKAKSKTLKNFSEVNKTDKIPNLSGASFGSHHQNNKNMTNEQLKAGFLPIYFHHFPFGYMNNMNIHQIHLLNQNLHRGLIAEHSSHLKQTDAASKSSFFSSSSSSSTNVNKDNKSSSSVSKTNSNSRTVPSPLVSSSSSKNSTPKGNVFNRRLNNNNSNINCGNDKMKVKSLKRPRDPNIRTCQHCKDAHVYCDGGRPCERCVKLNKCSCVDAIRKKRGRPKKVVGPDGSVISNRKKDTAKESKPSQAIPPPNWRDLMPKFENAFMAAFQTYLQCFAAMSNPYVHALTLTNGQLPTHKAGSEGMHYSMLNNNAYTKSTSDAGVKCNNGMEASRSPSPPVTAFSSPSMISVTSTCPTVYKTDDDEVTEEEEDQGNDHSNDYNMIDEYINQIDEAKNRHISEYKKFDYAELEDIIHLQTINPENRKIQSNAHHSDMNNQEDYLADLPPNQENPDNFSMNILDIDDPMALFDDTCRLYKEFFPCDHHFNTLSPEALLALEEEFLKAASSNKFVNAPDLSVECPDLNEIIGSFSK